MLYYYFYSPLGFLEPNLEIGIFLTVTTGLTAATICQMVTSALSAATWALRSWARAWAELKASTKVKVSTTVKVKASTTILKNNIKNILK